MKPKALNTLASVSHAERVQLVSEGLDLLVENIQSWTADAEILVANQRYLGAARAASFATEEAGKIFVLLDYARANFPGGPELKRVSSHFYSHLARLIYVSANTNSPATMLELRKYTAHLRRDRNLDGFCGEVVTGNPETSRRDERFYVDLVDTGERVEWIAPDTASWAAKWDAEALGSELALDMQQVGLFTPNSLRVIADVWSKFSVDSETHWRVIQEANVKCLEGAYEERKSETHEYKRAALHVLRQWSFPLWDEDLSKIRVPDQELERERAMFFPIEDREYE